MNSKLIEQLNNFHGKKAAITLIKFSDIAGDQFPGEFNVSGFHKQILDLSNNPRSIWGIDRCLRIQEIPDELHSYLFHMAIYAKSIDLQDNFINPFKDGRFHKLQKEIILQLLELLELFNVDFKELEVSYLDGSAFGGTSKGRDRLLNKKYKFPSDIISKDILKNKVELFPVKSIACIDINANEGSLVGPRLEIAYKGIEIGTIVFDCFKIEQGNLKPINYVAGYAIGLERLISSLKGQGFLKAISRYDKAFRLLGDDIKAAKSSLFEKEVLKIIFAAEAISKIPNKLSKKQKERIRELKRNLRNDMTNLGLDEKILNLIIKFFKKWKYL